VVTIILGYPYYRLTHRTKITPVIDEHEPTNQEIRQSPEYRAWAIAVKKRDNFRCVFCGSEQNLEAHHIYSFASFRELRFDLFNGLTVCRECHKKTPNYGSKEKAFSQQLKQQ
jgi:5-methylcytosine-specific restriction endonuclease McrA